MLPPTEYEATLGRLLSELRAGGLEPDVSMSGAPKLSELVRVEKIAAEVGLEQALEFLRIEPEGWARALHLWGPALNAVEVHARRRFWAETLDVSAEVSAIRARK